MNEVPDDQKIADESGALQNVDFVIETLDQFRIRSGALTVAIVQTFVAKLPQVRFARLPFRHRIFRIFRNAEFELEIDPVGDRDRVRDRLGMIREERPHFVSRFEVKLGRIPHPAFVVHHLAGAYTNHHIVRLVVAALEKMDVVRRDQSETEFFSKPGQHLVAFVLHLDAVIVHFEKKILGSEDVAKFGDALARLRQIVGLDRHVDLALEAATQPD